MADQSMPKSTAAEARFLDMLADRLEALAAYEDAMEERITAGTVALVSAAQAVRTLGDDKTPKRRKAQASN